MYRQRPLNLLALLALALGSQACASHVVNSYHRARPLGPGHMESGVSLSWARQPANDVAFRQEDRLEGSGDAGPEPISPVPVPVAHFRLGVTERVDAGLDVSPTGAALSAKFAVFDTDRIMFAVVAKLGTWTRTTADGDDGFRASGPFSASLGFPLATRPLEWLELVITPNVGLISIDPTRLEDERGVASPKEVGEVSRPYTTPHAGFAIGASFAVWRVRINPEVNFVALFRPDHDRPGFFAAYPGVAAFFVY